MAPNTLANMHPQVTTVTDGDYTKIETQLWKYENYQLINRKSRLVLDVKQGVVRYGARIIQDVPKTGKVLDPVRLQSSAGNMRTLLFTIYSS
jgi:hypothetical protein